MTLMGHRKLVATCFPAWFVLNSVNYFLYALYYSSKDRMKSVTPFTAPQPTPPGRGFLRVLDAFVAFWFAALEEIF